LVAAARFFPPFSFLYPSSLQANVTNRTPAESVEEFYSTRYQYKLSHYPIDLVQCFNSSDQQLQKLDLPIPSIRGSIGETDPTKHKLKRRFGRNATPKPSTCNFCKTSFDSRNKMFQHFPCKNRRTKSTPVIVDVNIHQVNNAEATPRKIKSPTNDSAEIDSNGWGSRGYHYLKADARLNEKASAFQACVDTGCVTTLIDEDFLKNQYPNTQVFRRAGPITVRGFTGKEHSGLDHILSPIIFSGTESDAQVWAEIHLVKNLQATLLIGIDVLTRENVKINLTDKTTTIGYCENTVAPVSIWKRGTMINRPVITPADTWIQPNSFSAITFDDLDLPEDKDYLFDPSPTNLVSLLLT
jgi:hypothetical protein